MRCARGPGWRRREYLRRSKTSGEFRAQPPEIRRMFWIAGDIRADAIRGREHTASNPAIGAGGAHGRRGVDVHSPSLTLPRKRGRGCTERTAGSIPPPERGRACPGLDPGSANAVSRVGVFTPQDEDGANHAARFAPGLTWKSAP